MAKSESPSVAKTSRRAATENGCVIFAASGDNSSSDGGPGANVDMPSSCPHVIGCGGTTKTGFSEVVWGDGTPNGEGTGGGYSVLFPPQDFQLNAPPSPGQHGRMVVAVRLVELVVVVARLAEVVDDVAQVIEEGGAVSRGRRVEVGRQLVRRPDFAAVFAHVRRPGVADRVKDDLPGLLDFLNDLRAVRAQRRGQGRDRLDASTLATLASTGRSVPKSLGGLL